MFKAPYKNNGFVKITFVGKVCRSQTEGISMISEQSKVGGWGCKAEGSPTGNPSPAPSTRTARTTRQINGA